MNIVWVDVDELVPAPVNARSHGEEDVAALARIIERFGWRQPLVVGSDMVVHIGNGRLAAAKRLKQEKVPCLIADDLTEDDLRALGVADNRVAELSTWNGENLARTLREINFGADDLLDVGFTSEALEFLTGPIDGLTLEVAPPPPAPPPAAPGEGLQPPAAPQRRTVSLVCSAEEVDAVRVALRALIEDSGWESVKLKG